MKFEIDVQELLNKGAYFGHRIARTNPKAIPFTYKAQNGIYLIDLFQTKEMIEKALAALYQAATEGQGLLVVGTKRLVKSYIKATLSNTNVFFLSEKWVAGFLTNFDEIHKNIKEANQMLEEKQRGTWLGNPKHEISKMEKKLRKLLKVYEGVLKMEKIPENILIIDIKKEKNALKEVLSLKDIYKHKYGASLKLYGIVDTNADPTVIDYPMVLNDDSVDSLEYVVKHLLDAYAKGIKKAESKKTPIEVKK